MAGKGSKEHLILPYKDLLGTVRDQEIAALSGVSIYSVRNYRKRWGIPRFRPTASDDRGEQTEERPQQDLWAWKVYFDNDDDYLIAVGNLVDIAQAISDQKKHGLPVRIERYHQAIV